MNRVLELDELTEEQFETLYEEMRDNWGADLANTALGVPSMEVVFSGTLGEAPEGDSEDLWDTTVEEIPGEGGLEQEVLCAMCFEPMDREELPESDSPFGICPECRREYTDYLDPDG